MARPTWRQIAELLAGRLASHAFCDVHDKFDPGCPFCRDREAYMAYLKAGGRDLRPQLDGPSISLSELFGRPGPPPE
jgi:hypothetical protein